jgi:hypothetical protein
MVVVHVLVPVQGQGQVRALDREECRGGRHQTGAHGVVLEEARLEVQLQMGEVRDICLAPCEIIMVMMMMIMMMMVIMVMGSSWKSHVSRCNCRLDG